MRTIPSQAIMRREKDAGLWARDPLDWYVEPEWCSARLFEAEVFDGHVLDPACGSGRIVKEALRAGLNAGGMDIVRRSTICAATADFLTGHKNAAGIQNIVCNPPFGYADDFVKLALDLASRKVAMLLPATWHFGSRRAKWLETTPLARIYALTPRPSMPPGAVLLAGEKPGGGTKDFAWYVWHKGHKGPATHHYLHRDKPYSERF